MKKYSLILLIILLVMMPGILANWGITESSEARYAEISKEMYERGDYLRPTELQISHYHKPPLTYYITKLGYFICGINETGTRFFLMVALLCQLWLVYKISGLFCNDRTIAFIAMLLYFSYPVVQAAAKNLTTDCYLTSFIFAAIYFFLLYRKVQKAIYLYLFYTCCGLAFLTKGPVGLMPEALFAIFYNRIYPKNKSAGSHAIFAPLLGIAISLSWFIFLVIDQPGLFNYFIKYQLAGRVTSDAFNRTKPCWYYLLWMPVLALPGFFYFFDFLRNRITHRHAAPDVKNRILLLSLGISLLVFSLSSSKLVLYVLPLYLFVAIISARQLVHIDPVIRRLYEKICLVFSFILFLALIVACFIKLPLLIPKLPVLTGAATGLSIIVIAYRKKWDPSYVKGPLVIALSMVVLTFIAPFIMKENELKINSIKPLAQLINARSIDKRGSIAVYNYLLPSLGFYTNRAIVTIYNGSSIAHREIQFEADTGNWKKTYLSISGDMANERAAYLSNSPVSFLLARKGNDIPDSLHYLITGLTRKKFIDKWILYY